MATPDSDMESTERSKKEDRKKRKEESKKDSKGSKKERKEKKKKDKKKKESNKRHLSDTSKEEVLVPDPTQQQPTKKKKKHNNDNDNDNSSKLPFDHAYIVAPMVGASELPFRLLTRKYGALLAYTPMMSSVRFVREPSYRNEIFQTNPLDRPLVCHFSANSPTDFAKAVQLVADQCDAIDLNLGCPQRTAFVGHFGSYLLDPGPDRQLICDIVRAGVEAVSPPKPILVKIRLLETLDETIQLCRQLKDAGASLIAIHARKRAGWERKGPGARDGPAKLEFVTQIKQAVPNIPIIANGNVISYQDVLDNQTLTNADGIMSAEGILDNPALFLPRLGNNETTIQQTVTIVDPLLHCCFKDDATIPPLDESNN
eukprot:Sro1445_g273420.1 synthase (370) ;mRNA; f:28044-29155